MITNAAVLEITELNARAEHLARGSQKERQQADILLNRIKNIREIGLSTDEIRSKYAHGLSESLAPGKPNEAEYERRFRAYLAGAEGIETRDILAGAQSIAYSAGAAGGYTVPVQMESQVFEAVRLTDPVLDPAVTDFVVEPSPTLQPKVVTGYDLSAVSASLVTEGQQQAPGAFPTADGRVLRGNLIYKLSLAASSEAQDDIPGLEAKLARAMGVGFARKLGAHAVVGNGSTQPEGILTALPAPSYTTLNSGKLVLDDFLAIYFSVDPAYRHSPKCSWLFNDSVYKRVRGSVDSAGRPFLELVQDHEGRLMEGLLGKPIYVTPSIPGDVGGSPVSNSTIVFGDLSAFHIRCSKPTLQRTTQQDGWDVTKGEALYVARVRMDSLLLDPSAGQNPPVVSATVQG